MVPAVTCPKAFKRWVSGCTCVPVISPVIQPEMHVIKPLNFWIVAIPHVDSLYIYTLQTIAKD